MEIDTSVNEMRNPHNPKKLVARIKKINKISKASENSMLARDREGRRVTEA